MHLNQQIKLEQSLTLASVLHSNLISAEMNKTGNTIIIYRYCAGEGNEEQHKNHSIPITSSCCHSHKEKPLPKTAIYAKTSKIISTAKFNPELYCRPP